MKLKYVILYVPSVAEAVDFHERAFGLKPRMTHPSGDYAEMETGDTVLAFSATTLMASLGKTVGAPDPARPVFELAFETDDVPTAVDRAVAAGAALVTAPVDQPWGQTLAYVTDLNGYLVEICTPVSGGD